VVEVENRLIGRLARSEDDDDDGFDFVSVDI